MHELALSESVVRIVEAHAREAGAPRVRRITLEIGAGAAVEIEALKFCFRAAAEGSLAAGAALDIVEVPLQLRCRACGHVHSPAGASWAVDCPDCGGLEHDILAGRELKVRAIEIGE